MKWDTALKTIEPPKVQIQPFSLSETHLQQLLGYRNIQCYNPGLSHIGIPIQSEPFHLDQKWKWAGQETPAKKGECLISVVKDVSGSAVTKQAFCKITHLVDPIRWIKEKYTTEQIQEKQKDLMNQAYVEMISYFCLSRLREKDLSPHFPYFYGSFVADADTYTFNITDDYDSYRHMKWFWSAYDKQKFRLIVDNAAGETESELAELMERPSNLESDDESDGEGSDEEIPVGQNLGSADNASIHSADDLSFHSNAEESESDEETDLNDDISEPNFLIEVKDFPVMLMYLEKSDGVMDDFLQNPEMVGPDPGSAEWESIWSAWLFQVIAALCVAQGTLSLTHNDLHTNNIVWSDTPLKYLYYTRKDGTYWKVPTYGKIFQIIDYGRAIFRLKNKVIYSDDFKEGNDAATQYNFGPLRNSEYAEIMPNPSFDLCRLAVSLFEPLFPNEPPKKTKGKILSSEPGLEVRETTSDLFNVMWSWMVTDFGSNVLINADGEEKYPDFDLYKVIAEECHQARPCDQVDKKPFAQFKVTKDELPEGRIFYSLFI